MKYLISGRRFFQHREENGFTLIECMITMVLLSLGILALSAAQVTYFKSTLKSQVAFQADTIADQVLEVILQDPSIVATTNVSTPCSGSPGTFQGQLCKALSNVGSDFMDSTIVDVQNIDSVNSIWRVTVNWNNMGASHSLTKDIGLPL